ncbi:MAG: alkaline phosphatase family protein [Thiohalocapsa sp.]
MYSPIGFGYPSPMSQSQQSSGPRPDYQGGGIVNLMTSLIKARGGSADYAELELLPADAIAGAKHILLLVVDGLGADWLQRHGSRGLLCGHQRGVMTSVFPPTTASAITTYLTGDAPQQHALTGWHTWMRELGCVMTVLPGQPRYGGVGYRQAGIDATRLFGHRPVFDRMATPTVSVAPAHIAHSDFNRAHLGRAELRTFETLRAMFKQAARAIRKARSPSYLYLYWPDLDSIGHAQGIESHQALTHLQQIEQSLEDFAGSIVGTDTVVLVTADHGQIDTNNADQTLIGDHPELADCLTLPLCGEPRAAFCYVHPDRAETFEGYCREVFSGRFELHRSRDLLEAGLFGLGTPNPRLHERIGDYTLLATGNNVIREQLPFEQPFEQIGVHGGLSSAELMVPLCLLRC